MKRPTIELLAPAGDHGAAIGAINAGADAVYLGAPDFSARAFARNLTAEEIVDVIHYAHLFQRRVYLALNTLIKNKELARALSLVDDLYREGLDGIIVQDIGLLSLLHRAFPSLELHASTQMAVLSEKGAAWLKQFGVSRIVPGRELSLSEIAGIKKAGLEVECFIHGAMCYSYSGRCLLSSLAGGRSGNRGRCAGPCRKLYEIEGAGGGRANECPPPGYYLSMKDMCALTVLEELADAGVDSLKIEGRMKDPAYAAGTTLVYRRYLDAYLNGDRGIRIQPQDLEYLKELYIRSDIQEGYYRKHNGRDMISAASPSYRKISDPARRRLEQEYIHFRKKKKIKVAVKVFAGCPVMLRVSCGEISFDVSGDMAQPAQSRALSREEIQKQVSKFGNSNYEAESLEIETDGKSFAAVSSLNHLRRKAVELLDEKLFVKRGDGRCQEVLQLLSSSGKESSGEESPDQPAEGVWSSRLRFLRVQVENIEQLGAAMDSGCKDIIVPLSETDVEAPFWKSAAKDAACRIYLKLPDVIRQESLAGITGELRRLKSEYHFSGIYCPSLDALALAEEYFGREELAADTGIYVFNTVSEGILLEHAAFYSASYELNEKELMHFRAKGRRELILYGRQEVMHSAGCIQKTQGRCDRSCNLAVLRDGEGREFPVMMRHKYCYNTIFNCLPLSLHALFDDPGVLDGHASYRIIFTTEDRAGVEHVLSFFKEVLPYGKGKTPDFAYTTGHIKRGVL